MEFEMIVYTVYVLPDEENRIVDINSSAFLTDVSGWVEIDQGTEDKHHHAQRNYLPGALLDDRGICRYKLENGQPVERTQEEMDADWIEPETKPSDADRITALEEQIDMLLSGVTADE